MIEGRGGRVHGIDDGGQGQPPHVPHRNQQEQDGKAEFGPESGLEISQMPDGFALLFLPRVDHVGFRGHGRGGKAHFHGPLLNLPDQGFTGGLRKLGSGDHRGAVGGEAYGGRRDAVHPVQNPFQPGGTGGAMHPAHIEKKLFLAIHMPLLCLPISAKLL